MFTIIVEAEGQEPKRYDFTQDEVKIGREPGSDIHLPSSNVSKRHARIVKREGKYFIVDRKSTNGTFVNGTRVTTPQVLRNGDRIFIGDFVLIFQVHEEAEEAVPKPPPLKKKRVSAKPVEPSEEETSITPTPPPLPAEEEAPKPPPLKKKRKAPTTKVEKAVEPEPPKPAPELREVPPPPPPALPSGEEQRQIAAQLFARLIEHEAFAEEEDLFSKSLYDDDHREKFGKIIDELASELGISADDASAVKDWVLKEALGLGPFTELLDDLQVVEAFATSRGTMTIVHSNDGTRSVVGFSCLDALLLAATRFASMCGAETAETEDEPFSVMLPGKFAVRMLLSTRGGDSWIRFVRLPASEEAFDGLDKKSRTQLVELVKNGGRVVIAGESVRARGAVAASLLAMAEQQAKAALIDAPEAMGTSTDSVFIPAAQDVFELEAKLAEAATLEPDWIIINAPVTAVAPVSDILTSTSFGTVWLVPAASGEKALKAVKNQLIVQLGIAPDVAAQLVYESIDMVITCRSDEQGKVKVTKVERLTGAKGNMITAETVYKV